MERTSVDSLVEVEAYMEAVFRRGREAMEPVGFEPNWDDQPSRHKIYLGAEHVPLSASRPETRPVGRASGEPWNLAELGWMLRTTYAPTDRRLRVTWNQDTDVRELYSQAIWGRGAASGGGMYPLEFYVAAGTDMPELLPGLYHYSTARHGLERIALGGVSNRITAACPGFAEGASSLVVTTRFWKNSFKYNSFAYHVVTQDLGAQLYAMGLLAHQLGVGFVPTLAFSELAADEVIGLDPQDETVLALIPLAARGARGGAGRDTRGAAGWTAPSHVAFERSKKVFTFDAVTAVGRALLEAGAEAADGADGAEAADGTAGAVAGLAAPAAHAAAPAPRRLEHRDGTVRVQLPADTNTVADSANVAELLRRRKSSFGAFSGAEGLRLGEVASVLHAGQDAASRALPELPVALRPSLHLFAVRVDTVRPGSHDYVPEEHSLRLVDADEGVAERLQRSYYLSNYNLHEAAAVIAIALPWGAMRDAFGARGYRAANLVAAAAGQAINLAAASIGIGSGIVLGFDNISMDEMLQFEPGGSRTFLFVILGRSPRNEAAYRFDLA